MGDLYVGGADSSDVAVYNGQSGAYVRTLITAAAGLERPHDVTFGPDGNLYVAGNYSRNVLRYDFATDTVSTFIPASRGMVFPSALAFGPDGDLYVAQQRNTPSGLKREILRFDGETGALLGTFADLSAQGADVAYSMEFRPDGYLYVADPASRVLRFNGTTGAFHDVFVSAGSGGLSSAMGLAFGPDGDLYVISRNQATVNRYDGTTGTFLGSVSGGLDHPIDVAFGPDANGDGLAEMYVSNEFPNRILRYAGPLTATASTSLAVTVLDAVTNTYSSTPNAAIPSDLKTYSWAIPVADVGTVFDVNVKVDITHPNTGDLQVYLVSPSGRRVELFTNVGGSGDNFRNTILDDEAATSITAGVAPFTGTFRPEGSLSAFAFDQAQGTWRLEIRDSSKPTKGKLNSWSLTITRGVGPPALTAAAPASGTTGGATITERQVQALWLEAERRWQAAGVDTSALAGVSVRVADLGGLTLGLASEGTIWIDDDAAGWGWFVDATPSDDSEFTQPGDQGEFGRYDLLTALMHEMGHILGFDHDVGDSNDLMFDALRAEERRLP